MSDVVKAEPFALFWCDLETTGLDPRKDRILEIAWSLTMFEYPYHQFDQLDAVGETVIRDEGLVVMGPVVAEMHTRSGLLREMIDRRADLPTLAETEWRLLSLSQGWPLDKDRKVVIAGSSVHFDLSFLRVHMPTFAARLSHRTLDVSALSLFCRGLGMPREEGRPEAAHRARADLGGSMRIARGCVAWLRSL